MYSLIKCIQYNNTFVLTVQRKTHTLKSALGAAGWRDRGLSQLHFLYTTFACQFQN